MRRKEKPQGDAPMLAKWADSPEGSRPRTNQPRSKTLWNNPVVDVLPENVRKTEEIRSGLAVDDAYEQLRRLWTDGKIDHLSASLVEPMMPTMYVMYAPEHHVRDYTSTEQYLDQMSRTAKARGVSGNKASVCIDTVRFASDGHDLAVGKIIAHNLPDRQMADLLEAFASGSLKNVGEFKKSRRRR